MIVVFAKVFCHGVPEYRKKDKCRCRLKEKTNHKLNSCWGNKIPCQLKRVIISGQN